METEVKTVKVKSPEKVTVKLHQRRINGEVSEKVKELARQEGIVLEEGHTLVREHRRTMDTVKKIRYKVNKYPPVPKVYFRADANYKPNEIKLGWD